MNRGTGRRNVDHAEYIYGREARLERIRRRRRKAQIRRRCILLAAALVIAVLAGVSLTGFSGYPENSGSGYKYYTAITVRANDTLWGIAREHRPQEYSSMQAYMKEIREVNGIRGDRIYYGQRLILPCYSSEQR